MEREGERGERREGGRWGDLGPLQQGKRGEREREREGEGGREKGGEREGGRERERDGARWREPFLGTSMCEYICTYVCR